ncbi:penicillin-binding protein activator [Siccirubricoccus sp. G192]|uniref:penicillin-binding protein activator n=1 Tax=Siccirubricoccus sp. G192 TaxID=2849651 RepID=UPI001C2BBC2B|nr:penicillin-binding protein activator [Siccirubricoccus sp. G192]MBV1795861.1 penicillin-binding protein activator [Siccirubricoccus sp. G192]
MPQSSHNATGGLRRRAAALLLLLLPFAACAPQAPPVIAAPSPYYTQPLAPALPEVRRERVGLLLPLSGSNRPLGQAMLNAAQLALFDQADPQVEFLPRDTGGTASGAAEAARGALAEGARALAGPLTLSETAAAAAPARAARAPLLAFTSDSAQAGAGVWVLGMTPAEQVERVAGAAASAGARQFGLLAPADEFGRRLAAALQRWAPAHGLAPPVVVLHPPRGDVALAARNLAAQAGPEGLDAVVLGEAGAGARAAAAALAEALPRRPHPRPRALGAGCLPGAGAGPGRCLVPGARPLGAGELRIPLRLRLRRAAAAAGRHRL